MQVNLDSPLPAELSIGAGTAVFVAGTCFDRERELTELSLVVDGAPAPPLSAAGMPRLDYFRALHPGLDPFATRGLRSDPESAEDPLLHSYRSGFWGLVRIEPGPRTSGVELGLEGRDTQGRRLAAGLGVIPLAPRADPAPVEPPGPVGDPAVAICMATYDPPPDLFAIQIESIRSQTHTNWVCVISDDCSRPERLRMIEEVVRSDPRFFVSRSPRRLGFYRNFERALALAPPGCEYVAMADQDDRWYPEKLESLMRAIGSAQLIYSDARIVARDGRQIAPTYWGQRRNNHWDLESLLVANSVTGAASLLRRGVLDYALPFPPAQFAHYHDHWVGLVSLVLGGIEYLSSPLYDYVQHSRAALGHAQATRITRLHERLERIRSDPRERVRVNRTRYFVDVMRLMAFATVLDMRCHAQLTPGHARVLERFLALDRSWSALAGLAGRAARELSGPPETLGAEWELFQALAWRRLMAATARSSPSRRLRLDALPPPDLAPRAARRAVAVPAAREIAEKVAPLELSISDRAPVRLNLLIPTIDLQHFFGGYIAKFNLAARLAARGARVRLVTVDPVGPLPRAWRAAVESYSGLTGVFERIELAFGRGSGPLEVSREDGFVATTWWTAHVAHAALTDLGRSGFIYLIQEYEPFTFPMGSYAALAEQSYGFPHFGLFSTELLREYFSRHRIGVYASGEAAGQERSLGFENAITAIEPPTAEALSTRPQRRLLFYARPEAHAARNLFELGILGLTQALEEGAFREGWELHGIGTVGSRTRVGLGPTDLELLPRSSQTDYADLLRGHDIGLALMYTPHPSLVPIEMASAGMLAVTNTFENKTPDALAAISPNLIAGPPTVQGVAEALLAAAAAVEDHERRVRGSAVRWSRDWDTSFPAPLLARLESYLDDRRA